MTDAVTHIRRLFLEPKDTYAIPEAAVILGMELDDVRGWMEVGELEGVLTREGLMLSWEELASFGMDFWTQEAIEAALGADLADAIPELLRLAGLEVRISRLEILALESLVERDGKSVDVVLARELLDVVSAHSEYLATALTGFTAALRWPQGSSGMFQKIAPSTGITTAYQLPKNEGLALTSPGTKATSLR
jgi:hypothetical protein